MKTSTAHIFSDILTKIDHYIDNKEYSTRADFVLHAMRHTLSMYAQKKKQMTETYFNDTAITTAQLDSLYSSITQLYLQAYNEYKGDTVQINIRVPEGLSSKISPLMRKSYGFDKRSDYIKVSIMCLLSDLNECECIFENTKELVDKEQELINKVYKEMILGLIEHKSGKDILSNAYDTLRKK